jgi:hypothetical protein
MSPSFPASGVRAVPTTRYADRIQVATESGALSKKGMKEAWSPGMIMVST